MPSFGPNFFAAFESKSYNFLSTPVVTNHRFYFSFAQRLFICNNFFSIYDKSNILKLDAFSNITGQTLDQDLISRFNTYLLPAGFHYSIHSKNLLEAQIMLWS